MFSDEIDTARGKIKIYSVGIAEEFREFVCFILQSSCNQYCPKHFPCLDTDFIINERVGNVHKKYVLSYVKMLQ